MPERVAAEALQAVTTQSIYPLADGRWRADGLLWHMSGRWELRFDVEVDGVRQRLRHPVQLP